MRSARVIIAPPSVVWPDQAILEQAKHLGLAYGQALVAESEEEMTLLFDLAIHTAKPGRSRAIDRYAKSVALQPGSDEELTLDAMCRASFSLWRIERRHETAGVIVADLLRDSETWLLDEGLAFSAEPGMTVASRLCWPAEFAMTCGVIVPVDVELIEDALLDSTAWLWHANPESAGGRSAVCRSHLPQRYRSRNHGQRRVSGNCYGQLANTKMAKVKLSTPGKHAHAAGAADSRRVAGRQLGIPGNPASNGPALDPASAKPIPIVALPGCRRLDVGGLADHADEPSSRSRPGCTAF